MSSISEMPGAAPSSASEPKYRLLLVDGQDARTSRRLADMLREDGYAVEIVRDGAHAIGRLAHSPYPDALLTELALGHANLVAVCRFARIQRPGLPIFVLTSRPNSLREDKLGEPRPLVFTKPVDYAQLRAELVRALHQERDERSPEDASGRSSESPPADAGMR